MSSESQPHGQVTPTQQTLNVIAHAARLMMRCVRYDFDIQAQDCGWRVFYAVDVDVITLYLAPRIKSEYSNVFGDAESIETRALLARLIGTFIFGETRSPGLPGEFSKQLFIVHPHDDELARVLFAISEQALSSEAKLEEFLGRHEVRLKHDAPGDLADWLLEVAPELVDWFDSEYGPPGELKRFEKLEETRLLNVERYLERDSQWTFPLPRPEESPQDSEEFTVAYSEWKERLLEFKSSGQRSENLLSDAYVLATIEILNRRMAPEKKRIVLVTGTTGILRAAERYRVTLPGRFASTFAHLYVRHPQAFMADPLFFGKDSVGDSASEGLRRLTVSEWLNVLFRRATRQSDPSGLVSIDYDFLRACEEDPRRGFQLVADQVAAEQSPTGRRTFPDSMLEDWKTQIHSASISRRITQQPDTARAREFIVWLQGGWREGVTLDEIRRSLANRTVQALSSLYIAAVRLGLWSKAGTYPESIRGIPALRFDNFLEATNYCSQVISSARADSSDARPNQDIPDLEDMYLRLAKTDPSHYHAHVIHALAYATKGHWHAARTLGRVALEVVDTLPDSQRGACKGREAAYLLAVTERRLATKLEHLAIAERYIEEAQNREDEGKPEDIRFTSERIALDVARLNFQVFVLKAEPPVAALLEQVSHLASSVLATAEKDNLKVVRRWVEQQVLTNVLDVALVARRAGIEMPADVVSCVSKCVAKVDFLLNKEGDDIKRDDVAQLVWLVALVVFGVAHSTKRDAMRKLNELKFPVYSPFDKAREDAFRELAERAASSGRTAK